MSTTRERANMAEQFGALTEHIDRLQGEVVVLAARRAALLLELGESMTQTQISRLVGLSNARIYQLMRLARRNERD